MLLYEWFWFDLGSVWLKIFVAVNCCIYTHTSIYDIRYIVLETNNVYQVMHHVF